MKLLYTAKFEEKLSNTVFYIDFCCTIKETIDLVVIQILETDLHIRKLASSFPF